MDFRVFRRVLIMVGELHKMGYERIRIAPGMAPSGCYWRCAIAPVTLISSQHGARIVRGRSTDTIAANYSSANKHIYFGWDDAADSTPLELADLFVKRFPRIAEAGRGDDHEYAQWYQEMLKLTSPDAFPIAYADWDLPSEYLTTTGPGGGIKIPNPPPSLAHVNDAEENG